MFVRLGTAEKNSSACLESPKHVITQAESILSTGDPVKYIFGIHQCLHVGDEILSKTRIAAVGCQSCLNSKGIQPATDGTSGKGKTDSDKKFGHLLPQEYVLSGSISDKVLFYKKINPGTYIQSDDVNLSDDFISTIKRATSNFQQYTPHHTLDKDRKVIENSLPPRLVWALSSVDNVNSLQLINRQFGCSVDESFDQDERVLVHQKISGMLGSEELPVTDEVLICREIFRELKKHLFRVIIPYNYIIEWKDSSNRRNFDMFEDMIRGFAVYRFKQRKCFQNVLFADFQDFDDAISLYCKRTEQQGYKLTDSELKLIMKISEFGEASTQILQKETGLSQGRISHLIKGKGKDSDSGLIHKVKGLYCEKRIEQTGNGTATRTYYSLRGFDKNQYKQSVVWIDATAKSEFLHYYQLITSLLLKKIDNSNKDITYNTQIYNIHTNKKYNLLLKSVLEDTLFKELNEDIHSKELNKDVHSKVLNNDSKNPEKLLHNSEKGNKGNNLPADNDQRGNNLGNNLVITSRLLPFSGEKKVVPTQVQIMAHACDLLYDGITYNGIGLVISQLKADLDCTYDEAKGYVTKAISDRKIAVR